MAENVEPTPSGEWFEITTEDDNGRQTVHRVHTRDVDEAEAKLDLSVRRGAPTVIDRRPA